MGVKVRERPKGSGVYWVFITHNWQRKAKKVGDRRSAMAVARQIEQKLSMGDLKLDGGKPKVPLFKEYADMWLENYAKATCKETTYRLYKMFLTLHILPAFGNRTLDSIMRADFKSFIVKKINEGLSVSSILNIRACLSGIYSNAVEDGIVSVNPALGLGRFIRKFKKTDRRMHINPLTRQEVTLFLETARQHYPRYYPLFLCLLRTGMRIGEAIGLQWGDIDFNNRFIEVTRIISMGKVSTPKNGKSRRVDMSMQLAETLEDLRTQRKIETLRKGLVFHAGMGVCFGKRHAI